MKKKIWEFAQNKAVTVFGSPVKFYFLQIGTIDLEQLT